MSLLRSNAEEIGRDHDLDESIFRWCFLIALTIALTCLNYRGLDVVGNVAIVICIVSLLPFLVFCIYLIPSVQPSRWLIGPKLGFFGVNWRLLLNTFFWNINFWESAACYAADVDNPAQVYPVGMGLAVFIVFIVNFVPVLIGTGASAEPYENWTDGYFVHLAKVEKYNLPHLPVNDLVSVRCWCIHGLVT
jgi:amino acid transporter